MRAIFLSVAATIIAGTILVGCARTVTNTSASCTRATADRVTAREMLKDPDGFEGRCVRLDGTVANRSIFDDVQSLYNYMAGRSTNAEPHYVAIYSSNEAFGDTLWSMRANVEVVGFASTCDNYWKRSEESADAKKAKAKQEGLGIISVPFVAGECHYRSGPLIFVREAFPRPGDTRFTGEAARKKYGDAMPLADPPDDLRKPVETLIKALQSGERAGLENVEDDWAALPPANLLDPKKSPYAFLIGRKSDPQTVYWGPRNAEDDTVGVACICIANDCSKDWPISYGDMYRGPRLPYQCLMVLRNGHINGI